MESLTVPIGLTPKLEKGKMPDLNSMVIQELQYSFMARQYNLFELEKELVWPDDCEYHQYIEDLNWLIETRIKEFRDENVEQKQKDQNLDNYHMTNYKSHLFIKEFETISRLVL